MNVALANVKQENRTIIILLTAHAKAQLSENLIFLTGDISLSFGLYHPGAPL